MERRRWVTLVHFIDVHPGVFFGRLNEPFCLPDHQAVVLLTQRGVGWQKAACLLEGGEGRRFKG